MIRTIQACLLVVGALLLTASAVNAAATPEQACQNGRYAAAAKYAACEQKATGKYQIGFDYTKYNQVVSKCRVKYTSTWAKLQAKSPGSTCDNPRFDTTSAPGTVIDRLTSLQWEQKTDDASVHDKDNLYSLAAAPLGTAADGSAYTSFLPALAGFAGQHDWRLPTSAELQTILSEPYECTTSPCIDQGVFGPTVGATAIAYYWSATTYNTSVPISVWVVDFHSGQVIFYEKNNGVPWSVRAVRGGL